MLRCEHVFIRAQVSTYSKEYWIIRAENMPLIHLTISNSHRYDYSHYFSDQKNVFCWSFECLKLILIEMQMASSVWFLHNHKC